MMAQVGHMDRQTSLEYVHIQQSALERAQRMIEREQTAILKATKGVISASQSRNRQPRRLPGRVEDGTKDVLRSTGEDTA
jgi:hypothetical protein